MPFALLIRQNERVGVGTIDRWRLFFLLAALQPFVTCAETLHLLGRVGEYPVAVTLNKDGDKLAGWYFYLSAVKEIRLTGSLAPDGRFHLVETANASSKVVSGLLDGVVSSGGWTATWRKNAEAPSMPVELQSANTAFADKTGTFRCVAQQRDAENHSTYRSQLTLGLAAGKVSKLNVEQTVTGRGDEQACSISLDDLEPARSTSGVLLRSDAVDTASASGRCSVRIVGNERMLWIMIGDRNRPGDDCRGADDVMFCSARGAWRDIVLDRQSQKCRFLE